MITTVTKSHPELAASVLLSNPKLVIMIGAFENGYHPYEEFDSEKEARTFADGFNARHEVTPAQRRAMEIGSMFGWDVPGANVASAIAANAQPLTKDCKGS